MSEVPRVRFAPSPTGFLHVGGARTALFNWLFARKEAGVFVLRIEDTDRERSSEEMTQVILEGLEWLGLTWDEGPFHQADGFAQHRAAALTLLENGFAYRCFCSAEALQAKREAAEARNEGYRYDRSCVAVSADEAVERAAAGEQFTVRFRVPEGETEWDDIVHGPTRFRNDDIEDFIILRSDATPIYNLAVVSDDIEMRITHVIRGDDHLSNTPKQILLYRALGAEAPRFAHVPMILGSDGKRLSKRHGATAVGEYEAQGFLPQALVNFLALLGWSTGDDEEIMLPADLIARFSLERINKKSAIFDRDKLEWMNGRHLALAPADELFPLVAERLLAQGLTTEPELVERHDWFLQLIDLLKTRGRFVDDIVSQAEIFLSPAVDYDPDAVAKHWRDRAGVAQRLQVTREALSAIDAWEPESIERALRETAEREGVGFGKVVHPLRLAVTGTAASPGIDVVLALLGRSVTQQRIDAACRMLAEAEAEEKG